VRENGDVRLFTGHMNELLESPAGPVGQFLEGIAETVVVPDARRVLGTPAPFKVLPSGFVKYEKNETGIPYFRTGNLQDSIKANPSSKDEFGLVCFVSADLSVAPYAKNLLTGDMRAPRQGHAHTWKFLPPRPYYFYPGEGGLPGTSG